VVSSSVGEQVTDSELTEMIRDADTNGDNQIDYKGAFFGISERNCADLFCVRIREGKFSGLKIETGLRAVLTGHHVQVMHFQE
jgi:hypothetical protein